MANTADCRIALNTIPAFAEDSRLLFFSFTYEPKLNQFDIIVRSDEGKQDLRSLCEQKKKIWIWPNLGPLTCKKIQEADSIDTFTIDPSPPLKNRLDSITLISNVPFPKQNWTLNDPTHNERNIAKKLSRLEGSDRKLLNSSSDVRVLKAANNTMTFLVLPYKHIKMAPDKEEDGNMDHVIYKIFLKNGTHWKGLYESDKFPVFFGDLNGDGIPEVERKPYCDGDCYYYDSFFPATEILVEWNVSG